MKHPFAAAARWSSEHPARTIAIAFVAMIALGAGMSQAEPGRINELFVPDTLEALETMDQIREIWGDSDATFFLYLVDDPTDAQLIRAADADMGRLAASDIVLGVRGFPSLVEQAIGDLDDASDAEIQGAAQQLITQGRAVGFAVDDAILVAIDVEPTTNVAPTIEELDGIAALSTADADLRAGGLIYIEQQQAGEAGADVGILMPLSMVVVILVLSLLFRRAQDVVVPLVTTLVAIIMAYGTVAWAQLPLAPPSFIVMPLLLGLGVDYMLHIIYIYREQEPSLDIGERFDRTARKVGYPVFFTAVTTLIGFGSFLVSSLPQIRIWGLLIGTGAAFAFLLGFTLMPALYRLGRRKMKPSRQPLGGVLEPLARAVPKRPWITIGAVALVTVGLGVAAAFVEVTPEIEFEPDETKQPVIDFNAVQDRFGGQTLALFLIPAGDRDQLRVFEDQVEDVDRVTFVDGPIHRLERAGQPNGPLVGPATEGVATDDWWLVIAGYDFFDGEAVGDDLEALEAATPLDARLTGLERIQRESDAQFLPNIGTSTGIALGAVIILLFIIFRHPGYGALAFMPLVVTMVWQIGLMAIFQIPLNPITAVMTAMMIGVGVDYAIHMMSHYRTDRKAGIDTVEAAGDAIRSVGKPVLAATITTVFAFMVLGFSSLLPLRDFGRVAAIVVACAFVTSLTLLPAVLSLIGRDEPLARRRSVATAHAARGPNDRFTVKPRFSDPDVQAWYEETVAAKQARRRR